MDINDDSKLIPPGTTFIAYIDDSASYVGVVINENEKDVESLVLGYFTNNNKRQRDVFDPPFKYPFPSYETTKKDLIFPYSFEKEIALCKERDSEWWKAQKAPTFSNLIARHFRPTRVDELRYIHATQHLLQGGDIDDFKSFGHLDEIDFLKLWAVLYVQFPMKVSRPPAEWDVKNSNIYYMIEISDNKQTKVTCGLRSFEYCKTKKIKKE